MDLGIPRPRNKLLEYDPYVWPVVAMRKLPTPDALINNDFSQVLNQRRTRRDFSTVGIDVLSTFLNSVLRTKATREVNESLIQKHKPVVSSGAVHPIDLLLHSPGKGWFHYDDVLHECGLIDLEAGLSKALLRSAEDCVSISDGTLIVFVAELGKVGAFYENPDSLVWRDAGVLIGQMSLVAEALGRSFCPLGITGEPYISQLDERRRLQGVGMAILG